MWLKAARRFQAFIVSKPENSLKRLGVNAIFTPIWSAVDFQGCGDYPARGVRRFVLTPLDG
eukprot:1184097-Prorocentrum_minimum.AAC.1